MSSGCQHVEILAFRPSEIKDVAREALRNKDQQRLN
jgi:hypothetical protein